VAERPSSEILSSFADNNGVKIHYEVEGQGPPLLLVHPASGATQVWRIIGFVDALKDDYRLILVDMRGHGKSNNPHDPAAYTAATQAFDIVAVLDELGIDKANFFGYSLGAKLGWALAKYAPERFQSFIIGAHIPVVWDDSGWAA
jgi:pimeloyl-ACP methyl ester carboxylesterase